MRKSLFVFLVVLVSVAWAAAQQPGMGGQNNSTPGGRSVGPSSSSPDNSAGQSMPSAPSDQKSTSGMGGQSGNEQVVEGCLGGSAPDFTVTDKSGTVYKMVLPKDADGSPLSSHVGESVRVKGTVNGAASSAKSQSIQVEQVGRGAGTCAGSSAGSAGASGSTGTSGSTSGTTSGSGAGASSANPGASSGATPPKTK